MRWLHWPVGPFSATVTLKPCTNPVYLVGSTCIRHFIKSSGTTSAWVRPQLRMPPKPQYRKYLREPYSTSPAIKSIKIRSILELSKYMNMISMRLKLGVYTTVYWYGILLLYPHHSFSRYLLLTPKQPWNTGYHSWRCVGIGAPTVRGTFVGLCTCSWGYQLLCAERGDMLLKRILRRLIVYRDAYWCRKKRCRDASVAGCNEIDDISWTDSTDLVHKILILYY